MTVVPTGTRTSGPGTSGAFPSSANTSTSRPCNESPFGYHIAQRASSAMVNVSWRIVPADVLLSFDMAFGTARGDGAGRDPTESRPMQTRPAALIVEILMCDVEQTLEECRIST